MNMSVLNGRLINKSLGSCFCQVYGVYAQKNLMWNCSSAFISRNFLITSRPILFSSLNQKPQLLQNQQSVFMIFNQRSLSEKQQSTPEAQPLSNKDKLKRAVKDYGATVIVFHITISLMSLGLSYLIVSSGVDVANLLEKVGITTNEIATGASTFVVAYAFHKIFAPVRISITLGATPFIVRYLRRVKILKPPKISEP